MSSSSVYSRGSISNNSDYKRQLEQKASMYDDMQNRDRFNSAVRSNLDAAVERGRAEGANSAYMDITEKLSGGIIQEGSPQDIQMQENVNRGLNYQPQAEPSFMDVLNSKLEGAKDWFAKDPYADEVRSPEMEAMAFEQMQHDSRQAGLK